jgi:ABC-2 type transport system permease protein
MRLIYLVPLVLLAWKGVGRTAGVQAPVMAAVGAVAAGQLCGSLAWLTLSAEDAPDLLAVAPVPRMALRRRKLLAALLMALPFALIVPAFLVPRDRAAAVISLIGAAAAGWAAGSLELWLGKPGQRAAFSRRRHGSFPASLLGGLAALLIGGLTALAAYLA